MHRGCVGSAFTNLPRIVQFFAMASAKEFSDVAERPTVFITGAGRSGTTWLEDIVNFRQDHRIIFEPFWNLKVPLCAHFQLRQYLQPDDKRAEFIETARTILSGQFRNEWTDQFVRAQTYTKRLIKDVRANLMVRWLHQNFPEMPIVHLMRHPCAVVNSQWKAGWRRLTTHDLLEQSQLVEDFLSPFVDLIHSCTEDFDRMILLWCIENYVPLQQFRRGEILVMFYEDLVRQPEVELSRLCEYLRLPFETSIYNQHKKPSALVRWESAILKGADLLNSWQSEVSKTETQRACRILERFGLSRVYGEGSLPLANAEELLTPP